VKYALAIAISVSLLALAPPAAAQPDRGRLLIAVLDQVTWHDLLASQDDLPVLKKLAAEGGVGLMCVRTGSGWWADGGYLTLGAGARATAHSRDAGSEPEGYAFQVSEYVDSVRAGESYRSRTGWPSGDNAIVHLGIGELIRLNTSRSHRVRPGLMGGALRRAGLRVACIGNADTPQGPHRGAAAIAMDEQGLIELGKIDADLLSPDSRVVYGFTADAARIASAFRRVAAAADVVVLDLGETARAASYAELMAPDAAEAVRAKALARADRVLGAVLRELPTDDWVVLVLTPRVRPPAPGEEFALLAPIILRLPGGKPGLLTSPSTRRSGLVVNTDVAATVLEHCGLEVPADTVGRAITVEATPANAVARLQDDLLRHDRVELSRRYVFRWLPVLAVVALWSAALLFLLGDRAPRWARRMVRGYLVLLLAAPSAMLLVALRALPVPTTLLSVLGISLVLAVVGGGVTRWRAGHVLPSLALVILLVYDLVRAQTMLQWSPFSYSPASGARFYGLGNEYGGALLGATLIAFSALLLPRGRCGRLERLMVGVALAAVAFIIGFPNFGANLGMALACAVGFATFLLYVWYARPTWRDTIPVMLLALVVAAGAAAADIFAYGREASHIGRFTALVRAEGWQPIVETVTRKAAMNWTLLRVSPWADVATAALVVFGVALIARPRLLLAGSASLPWLTPAVVACLVGSLAAAVLNDSGVVAAGVALLYGAGTLAYVGLGDQTVRD